ncbi:MAG: hypothetical protein D6732_11425 [Methanobacteriota archaeon]|nr:MAG: hypothetical protein D6732_11425 [Euryarchaeota archaeon]
MEFLDLAGTLLNASFRIYIGVFLGVLWIRIPRLAKYRKQFVNLTINVFTPYLILVSMLKVDLTDAWHFPVLAGLLVTGLGLTVPRLIAKLQDTEPPDPAEIATASFSNAVNFPIPIIYVLAPDGLGIAAIFIAVSIIMRNTVGFWISGYNLTKESLKEILRFPPIWGIILGIIINAAGNKNFVFMFASSLVGTILFDIGIYMTLMTVGFGLGSLKIGHKESVVRVGITRFIVSFLVGLIMAILLQLPSYIAIPLIIQMGAPPAVYNGLYAEKFNMDTELTSDVIVILTAVALLVLPLELTGILLLFPS